jgi:phosphatidylserine decarboxylase
MSDLLLTHLYAAGALLAALVPLFALYRFWFFFRNPRRDIPEGDLVVSPADGRVLYVSMLEGEQAPFSIKKGKTIVLDELMDDPGGGYTLVIGIYMTPWSVHLNRIPFTGVVRKTAWRKGRGNLSMLRALLNLIFDVKPLTEGLDYLLGNERRTTVIEGERVRGAVVQIADRWIRRIVADCREGDRVTRGRVFGMIRMGSQCDLFLRFDSDHEVVVREGQSVKAGSSVLVRLR